MISKFGLEFELEFEFEFESELRFESTFAVEIERKFIFGLRDGQFWSPRGSFWTTLGAWEMYTCGNLASPRPDPIWGGEADPKSRKVAVSSSKMLHAPGTFGGLRT